MDVREQLLEAAVKVFAIAGFRGATTRRIAQEAGVNEVTLFRQFGSKEGLILEAVLRSVARLQDESMLPQVPVDPAAELLDWTTRHFEFVLRNHRLIKAAMADAQSHPDMACIGDRIGTSIELTLRAYLERLRDAGRCAPMSMSRWPPASSAGSSLPMPWAARSTRSATPTRPKRRRSDTWRSSFAPSACVLPAHRTP